MEDDPRVSFLQFNPVDSIERLQLVCCTPFSGLDWVNGWVLLVRVLIKVDMYCIGLEMVHGDRMEYWAMNGNNGIIE